MPQTSTPKKTSGGLGRGLGALIPQKPVAAITPGIAGAMPTAAVQPDGRPLHVKISDIIPNPEQPRTVFKHQELEDLMNSIREHGILQPLTVSKRPGGGYELIAGERRFRASKMLGLETVPVVVRDGDSDMNQKLVLALIENIQREDLNPLEEARGYQRLVEEFGMTQEEVSKRVGKARSTVANSMRLLALPQEVRDAIAAGQVPAGSARAMLALPDEESQLTFLHKLLAGNLSTRDVEAGVRRTLGKEVKKDPALLGAEEQLRVSLGTRVEVKKQGTKGQIIISFFSDEEYAELLRKLSK